jgi:hypothetical protein
MAWLDDRVWCHPKVAGLSDRAFRVHVCAITYSSGFSTAGVLTVAQQRLVGATTRQRTELVTAGLWDELEQGAVRIHDWDEHNGKRDARRAAERERMRRTRGEQRANSSANKHANRGVLTGDGSEGSEVNPKAVKHFAAERPQENTHTIPLRSVR